MPLSQILTTAEDYWFIAIAVIVFFVIMSHFFGGSRRGRRSRAIRRARHARKRQAAKRRLLALRELETPAQQFGYLRKVNHFVYEEMILAALEEAGYCVTHNQRYTGDGGIDGRFQVAGRDVLIQAKRYRYHIRAADVKAFGKVCDQYQLNGIFVHTGRTGRLAVEIGRSTARVDIVSGQRMLNLLTGAKFYPIGSRVKDSVA